MLSNKLAFKQNKILSVVDVVNNKKKFAIGTIAVLFTIVWFVALSFNKKQPPATKKIEEGIEITSNQADLFTWQAQYGEQLTKLNNQVAELTNYFNNSKNDYTALAKKIENILTTLAQQQEKLIDLKEQNNTLTHKNNLIATMPLAINDYKKLSTYLDKESKVGKAKFANEPKFGAKRQSENVGELTEITQAKTIAEKIQSKKIEALPTGAFFKAVLLNGLEAGTGQEAEANPQPVLMRIIDNAFLPNEYRYQVKSCFVLGSGHGSLSSERVYIRTVNISCVGNAGKSLLSAKLEGYIVDADGKIGLRGKLISRQGAKLGMAMLAGFSSGIASAFGNVQTTAALTPAGLASILTPEQSVKKASFTGLNSASQELAQFYINQAQNIYPVLDVENGRIVTITVSQNTPLSWQGSDEAIAKDSSSQANNGLLQASTQLFNGLAQQAQENANHAQAIVEEGGEEEHAE